MTGGDGGSCNGIRVLAARVTQYSATPHTTFQTKQSAARCQHTAEFIRNGCFYSETNFIGNTHTFTAAKTLSDPWSNLLPGLFIIYFRNVSAAPRCLLRQLCHLLATKNIHWFTINIKDLILISFCLNLDNTAFLRIEAHAIQKNSTALKTSKKILIMS